MYQPATNFWGKDPMRWWIGQVTDPDKGEWRDALEVTRAKNVRGSGARGGKENDIYQFRCRVRIVGYHGNDTDLEDKDLPLAHVLLPSNVSTTGGQGETMQYQGGEVVVGFFMDGDDGQQPVIFGTLYKQNFIEDGIKKSEFYSTGQTDFIPFTSPKSDLGKHKAHADMTPNSPGGKIVMSDNQGTPETISKQEQTSRENRVVDSFSPCEENEIANISNSIKDFTRKIQTLQQLNDQATYINPAIGSIVDINSEVQLATNRIHKSMKKLVRRGRSWVISETMDKFNKTLEEKTDIFNQAPAQLAQKNLQNTIFCNFEKIIDQLKDYLSKSLENMIGQVLDVPICGVENFMSDMFGQLNNIIDTNLGSLFTQLNNIQGGGIALPSETFSKAIKLANIITNVLDCDNLDCTKPMTFSTKNGISEAIEDNFSGIIAKAGLKSKLDSFIDTVDGMIEADPSAPNCDTNVLKCGPPRVDFLGGGGQGASGSAIVNALGNIIGVAINGPGFGFEQPPILSFYDSCDKGFGAGGYPVMGNVSHSRDDDGNELFDDQGNPIYSPDPNGTELGVVGVVITSPGQDYLPNTTETDLDGNIKEVVPDPNANYDGETSYITELDGVVVQNTGFGYNENDTITVDNGSITGTDATVTDATGEDIDVIKPGQAQVNIKVEDGFVIGANVVNGGFGFTDLPDLVINSDTGVGARLLPVLKFTKIEDASQLANLPQVSQDAVVTVISCIQK